MKIRTPENMKVIHSEPLPVGSMVVGVDTRYKRSIYEVLASSGQNLVLLFRKLRNCEAKDNLNPSIVVRPACNFIVTEDHCLEKTKNITIEQFPDSWLSEEDWVIKVLNENNQVAKVIFQIRVTED